MRRKLAKPETKKPEEDVLYFVVAVAIEKRRFEVHKVIKSPYAEPDTELVAVGDKLLLLNPNIAELYQGENLVIRLEFEQAVTNDQVMEAMLQKLLAGVRFFASELKGVWRLPYIYGYIRIKEKPQDSLISAPVCSTGSKSAS